MVYTKKKDRNRRYPAETITDIGYADDIALLTNTSSQAESLMHCLEQAAGGVGLNVNTGKTEYKFQWKKKHISTLNGSSLKLADKFTYLGSSVSSTESDIIRRIAKTWTAIDRLSIIWQSNPLRWNKTRFLPCSGCVNSLLWVPHRDAVEIVIVYMDHRYRMEKN